MFGKLKVGDRIRLSGGYDMEPKWLGGKECYLGTVVEFIPGQSRPPAAVVKLDDAITFDDISGDIVVLELRYVGAKWLKKEYVHVELCNFEPEAAPWKFRKQGKWVESHATYTKL
jgi:hypothetical protein